MKQNLERNLTSEALKTIKLATVLFFLSSILITKSISLRHATNPEIDVQSHLNAVGQRFGNITIREYESSPPRALRATKKYLVEFWNRPIVREACGYLMLLYANTSFSSLCNQSKIMINREFTVFACISNNDYELFENHGLRNGTAESGQYTDIHDADSLLGEITDPSANSITSTTINNRKYSIDFDHGRRLKFPSHICYTGHSRLFDAFNFTVKVYFEYARYRWNPENMTKALDPLMAPIPFIDQNISVSPIYSPHSDQICNDGNHRGRWLDGVWTPGSCRYKQNLAFSSYSSCMSKYPESGIQWAGDSNSRRVIKSMYINDQNRSWCDDEGTCECEDYWGGWGPFGGYSVYHPNYSPSAKVFRWDFVEGTTKPQQGLDFVGSIPTNTKVLVIACYGSWDTAFVSINDFITRIEAFVNALETKIMQFPVIPLIILRTGNYYCCTADKSNLKRFNTRKRILFINELLVALFEEKFSGNLKIWDSYKLGEGVQLAQLKPFLESCPPAHYKAYVVWQDANLLLNLIC